MTDQPHEQRITSASREIAAPAASVFELIADPAQQPRWDGNDNLAQAEPGQRIHAVGDVFVMTNTGGSVRENHIVEFEEGRRIAWMPTEPGKDRPGHLWRWELEELEPGRTLVTHTYDWSGLTDESRFTRARSTTSERLMASIERLAALTEHGGEAELNEQTGAKPISSLLDRASSLGTKQPRTGIQRDKP